MKYEKSEWYKGLLFAEQQSQDGWRVCQFDCTEQWFSWAYQNSEARQIFFGENEWLDGVRDYYKNRNHHTNKEFESVGTEFAQVIEDNFWELVLK